MDSRRQPATPDYRAVAHRLAAVFTTVVSGCSTWQDLTPGSSPPSDASGLPRPCDVLGHQSLDGISASRPRSASGGNDRDVEGPRSALRTRLEHRAPMPAPIEGRARDPCVPCLEAAHARRLVERKSMRRVDRSCSETRSPVWIASADRRPIPTPDPAVVLSALPAMRRSRPRSRSPLHRCLALRTASAEWLRTRCDQCLHVYRFSATCAGQQE